MTVYHIAAMFKRTYTNRQMLEEYMTSDNDMEIAAFAIALDGYPFN